MQKAKRAGRPVAESSPGDKLVELLGQWKQKVLSEGEERRSRASSVHDSTTDGGWQKLAERRAALRALTELASEGTRTACLGAGLLPIVELIATQPLPPLTHRLLDQVERTTWNLRLRPTDPSPIRHDADDPLKFLAVLLESVVPAWLDFLVTGQPAADGLTNDARALLRALVDLKAFSLENRTTQEVLWQKVAEFIGEVPGKDRKQAALTLVKDRKLVECKAGTGTWLTDTGVDFASREALLSNSN